jgi:hypothetical protein
MLWKEADLIDQIKYQKPKYNPYETFNPTKSFLNDVIKQLRSACYQLLGEGESDEFARWCNQDRLDKLNRRIREYQYRLNVPRGREGHIGDVEIRHAKEKDIREFFIGSLRKMGKDSVGLCPFHNDKHPSFTIYNEGRRFKCFSCGITGDTPDFIMKTQNLTFLEAVKWILKI